MRRFCARPSGLIAASQDMSATAIRQWVRETAQRLEDELAEEQDIFILAASETGSAFGSGRPAYRWNRPRSCPCKDQRSRGDGWFEVIVRESMSRGWRIFEVLRICKSLRFNGCVGYPEENDDRPALMRVGWEKRDPRVATLLVR